MSRQILILARRDTLEAIRVSAGLTIFGHQVTLVLMGEELSQDDYQSEHFDMLELAEIEPVTMVEAMAHRFTQIDTQRLGACLATADAVLNI